MSATSFTVMATVCAVVSVIIALALPLVLLPRMARFSVLRERYLQSRRGWIIVGCVLVMVADIVIGVVVAAAAAVYPFLWATTALLVSAFITTAIYMALYIRAAHSLRRQSGFFP
jgi:hypothetical protein